MDIREHNRGAWDRLVEQQNEWTVPVSSDVIEKARRGQWSIVMTPLKPVPREWFPPSIKGLEILCLASGGGQQGPVLAAAGAHVIVLDNSPRQLEQDKMVAEREGLEMRLIEGDMRDLSVFADETFDCIVHPTSNLFVPDVKPVWRECYRVLKSGGTLIAGFCNPIMYMFDLKLEQQGILQVKYAVSYSDQLYQYACYHTGIKTGLLSRAGRYNTR
ncbi:MAG: class I SAM-dependent methyltransferase [Dehalococcoidales bacterium]